MILNLVSEDRRQRIARPPGASTVGFPASSQQAMGANQPTLRPVDPLTVRGEGARAVARQH